MKRLVGLRLGAWQWLVICCAALGCQGRDPTPAGRGARIFQRTCAGCHGQDGRGTDRPGLTKPARDLTKAEFQAQITNQQLRQSIRIGKGQMPGFAGLMAEDDIADVIAFIRTLAPPGTVLPPGSVPLAPVVPASPVSAAAAPSGVEASLPAVPSARVRVGATAP